MEGQWLQDVHRQTDVHPARTTAKGDARCGQSWGGFMLGDERDESAAVPFGVIAACTHGLQEYA